MSSVAPSFETKNSAERLSTASFTSPMRVDLKTQSDDIFVLLDREKTILSQEKMRIMDCITKGDDSDCSLFKAAMRLQNTDNPTTEDYNIRKKRIFSLLKRGKNLKSNDGFGLNPIAYAACQGHRKVVKYFLEYLAKRDIKEFNLQAGMAVYYSSLFGNTDVIAQVFKTVSENTSKLNKARLHPKQFMKWTPASNPTTAIELCILLNEKNHTNVAKILLNNGVALDIGNPIMLGKNVSFCRLVSLFPNKIVLQSLLQQRLSQQDCFELLNRTLMTRDIKTLEILISPPLNAEIGDTIFLESVNPKKTFFHMLIEADWMEAIKLMAPPYGRTWKSENNNFAWYCYYRTLRPQENPHDYLEFALSHNKLRALVGLAYWGMGYNILPLILKHAADPMLINELLNSGYLDGYPINKALQSIDSDTPPKNIEILLRKIRNTPFLRYQVDYSCGRIMERELERMKSYNVFTSTSEEWGLRSFIRDTQDEIQSSLYTKKFVLKDNSNYSPYSPTPLEVIALMSHAQSKYRYNTFPLLLNLLITNTHLDLWLENITGPFTLHCTQKEENFIQCGITRTGDHIAWKQSEKATFSKLSLRMAALASPMKIPVFITSRHTEATQQQIPYMMLPVFLSSSCFQHHLNSLVSQVSEDWVKPRSFPIRPSLVVTKYEEWRENYLGIQTLFACFSRNICKIIDEYNSDTPSFISECCPSLKNMKDAPEPLSYFFSANLDDLLPELYFALKAEKDRRERERKIKTEHQKLLLHAYPTYPPFSLSSAPAVSSMSSMSFHA